MGLSMYLQTVERDRHAEAYHGGSRVYRVRHGSVLLPTAHQEEKI
jgi:hypothetical protein